MDVKNEYLWVEKYRPTSLDTYIGNDNMKAAVARFIQTGDVPHLLLSGPAGTGKTTVAKIIARSIDCDLLYINASDENNVDTVRSKIKNFASGAGFKDMKIVILDESDYITPNAQAALRNLMETFSQTTRFILTCNYVERIIDPLISRTQQFNVVPPSKADVGKHLVNILKQEEIEFDIGELKLLIDAHYPDIRKVIQECQLHSHTGKLAVSKDEIISSDFKLKIVNILSDSTDKKKKFQEIRQSIADAKVRDFSEMYRLLYDRVEEYAPKNISQCIVVIAEGQYKDGLVVDKEINFMAMVIQLLQSV